MNGGKFTCVKLSACFLLLIGLLLPVSSFARKLDSLLTLLNEHPFDDTTRVLMLDKAASLFQQGSGDSMEKLAEEALQLSQNAKFERGIAISLTELGTYYLMVHEYEKAYDKFEGSLVCNRKMSSLSGQSLALYNMGRASFCQLQFGKALENFNQSIEISRHINDQEKTGLSLTAIGNIYRDLGNYPQAVKYYLDGLQSLEKVNDREGMATVLTNISTVYSRMGDFKKAIEYINKSLDIDAASGDAFGKMYNIVSMGVVYGESNDYSGALASFNKALHLADSLHNVYWVALCKADIAEAYFFLGEYDKAYQQYAESAKEAQLIREANTVAAGELGMGNVLMKKGKSGEGIRHMLTAYNILEKIGDKEHLFETTMDLSDAYEKIHDYTNALRYHKIYFNLRDSLYNEHSDKRIQQLQFDYELGKKESRIALLEKNKVIEQDRLERQKVVSWALISGLGLLFLVIIVLYWSRLREKRNKENILKQKIEIGHQADKLAELNRFKDKTFSVLSHDLRGPLQALSTTMSMMDDNLISPNEFSLLRPEINKQLSSLNILLENLLNWAKGYIQGQTLSQPVNARIKDLASQTVRLLKGLAEKKEIVIENNIPESISAHCDPGQLDIVFRNLVLNAIKFTRSGGVVSLSATEDAGNVMIAISDTGVGMTNSQIAKLFTPVSGNNTYGTEGETGTGLGLLLCYEFIKANNGTITVSSIPAKGSTFMLSLPKAIPLE